MSKEQKTSSKFLNAIKQNEHHKKDKKGKKDKKIEPDRSYVEPQLFKAKTPKKEHQAFFVSRINKPAKYTENPNFFKYLIYRIGKDDASGLSAQLAYYFLLALFPMLIFLLSLVPLFNINREKITSMITENAPGETATLISGIIDDIMKNASSSLLSIGLILALWSASNGMTALMNAFNVAYDVEEERNAIILKLMSVIFTLILTVVFSLAMVLPAFGQQIGQLLFGPLGLDEQVRWVFSIVRFLLPGLIVFILFLTLYTIAPNVKIKLKSVVPGALFTTVVWVLATYLFGLYVSNFANYSKTYGSIGGIIILMLWLYITGFIIIIGAEINSIIHQRNVVKGKTPEEQTYSKYVEDHESEEENEEESISRA